MLQLHSKQSAKAPPQENSMATGGTFESNTSHYGARLVEESLNNILIFGHFKFPPLKSLLYVAITTVDWSKPFKLLCVLLDFSICSLAMISP